MSSERVPCRLKGKTEQIRTVATRHQRTATQGDLGLSVRLIPKGVTARENLKFSPQGRSERCRPMRGTGGDRKRFRKRKNTAQEMETNS